MYLRNIFFEMFIHISVNTNFKSHDMLIVQYIYD